LDSAMKYCGLTLEMFTRGNVNKYKGAMLKNLGVVHEKRGEDGIALEYYRSAVQHDLTQKGEYLLSLDYIALAKYFYKKNQLDSCIYYANEASMLAIHSSVIKNIMEASDLLTKAYQAKGKIDSAFKYQGIGVMAKDSLFSQEKTRHVQFLSYKEEQRQKQIAEDKELAKEVRKKNLQLFGISIFLISFILFLILLSRRRIKPRTIQFFGVFALLMVFEFINLFIHPFIEELTHHSQVEMLLILVAIAAILVPMHHRLEKWVKNSLAKKKMLIRDPGLTEDEMGTAPILVESKQPLK